MKGRKLPGAIGVLLLLIGTWQLGHGAYIYAKALVAQHLLRSAWAQTLAGPGRIRPWSWADTWPVARLRVRKYGQDLIVLAGASGRTLAFGPGHVDGTPLPGQPGNSLISGHRDTHFRFLEQLQTGDLLDVQTADGRTHHFRVLGKRIVDSRNATVPTSADEAFLTLITCYPFDAVEPGGPLRMLVTAVEVEQ